MKVILTLQDNNFLTWLRDSLFCSRYRYPVTHTLHAVCVYLTPKGVDTRKGGFRALGLLGLIIYEYLALGVRGEPGNEASKHILH